MLIQQPLLVNRIMTPGAFLQLLHLDADRKVRLARKGKQFAEGPAARGVSAPIGGVRMAKLYCLSASSFFKAARLATLERNKSDPRRVK